VQIIIPLNSEEPTRVEMNNSYEDDDLRVSARDQSWITDDAYLYYEVLSDPVSCTITLCILVWDNVVMGIGFYICHLIYFSWLRFYQQRKHSCCYSDV